MSWEGEDATPCSLAALPKELMVRTSNEVIRNRICHACGKRKVVRGQTKGLGTTNIPVSTAT